MEAIKIGGSWLATIVVYGLAALVLALLLANRARVSGFLREVRTELAKCSWPWDPEQTGLRRYKVLIDSTVVVCVTSVLLAGYTAGFDFLINNLIGWMIKF